MNPSFIVAMALAFLGSFIVGLPLAHLIVGGAPFVVKVILGLGLGGLYLIWVHHNTPTANRSAAFWFGTRPFRVGPDGKGLMPGLNALLFGWPILIPKDRFTGQETVEFKQMTAISKDNVVMTLTGTYQRLLEDVYAYFGIKDPEAAVQSTVLKGIRTAVEEFNGVDLVSQDAAGVSMRNRVAYIAYTNIMAELGAPEAGWGYVITQMLQVNHIDLPETYKISLLRKAQAEADSNAEDILVTRRAGQIRQLGAEGVDPALAITSIQVDAGKTGASVSAVNVPGLKSIGEAIGKAAGDVLAAALTKGSTP